MIRLPLTSPRLWLAAFACACATAFAQPPAEAPMAAVRLQPGEKIPLDGSLSAPAWQRAPVFEQTYELEPQRGHAPDYPTRVRVLYDERAIYVGVEAIDPHPEQIRAPLVRHDFVFRSQDFVVLYLDPVGNRRAAQFFRVSASGGTADGLHTADNDNEDFSPDFDFDSATQRNEHGYTVVFRIPYSSLRYTAARDGAWRIMVGRRVPREQFVLQLSVPLPQEALSFIDLMQPLAGFEPPAQHAFLQVRPTLTVRHTDDRPFGEPRETGNEVKPSVDIKWRPRPELVLDATLNPDFSQVALDVPQLSHNTRFALYQPEKRPFFLESADLLVSPTDSIYTRSVNDPRWGLRASWRGEGAAGVAIAASDKGGGTTLLPGAYGTVEALQPANDTLALRLRRPFGPVSLGVIASERRYRGPAGADDGDNSVLGVDGQWLISDSLRLKAQVLGSRTTALADDAGELHRGAAQRGGRVYLDLYGRTDHSETDLTLEDISAGYRDDAGFLTQAGVRKAAANQSLQWFGLGPFNQFNVYLSGSHTQARDGGETISSKWTPGIWFSAARNTQASFEFVPAEKTRVAAGTPLLTQRYLHFSASTTPVAWMPALEVSGDTGRLVDVTADRVRAGWRLALFARLRALPRLELEPRVDTTVLRADGEVRHREVAAQLLGIWHVAARQSLRLILQHSSYRHAAEPALNVAESRDGSRAQSLTYAYRRSAGTVLYVGASHGTTGLPATPSRGTELFAKLQFDVDEWRLW